MDVINLEKQYRDKTLSEFIEAHTRTMTREILVQAIRGTLIEFDEPVRPRIEAWAAQYLQTWLVEDRARSDLGDLFSRAMQDLKTTTQQAGLELDDNRLFDLFHVCVLKLALLVHTDTEVNKLFCLNAGGASFHKNKQ